MMQAFYSTLQGGRRKLTENESQKEDGVGGDVCRLNGTKWSEGTSSKMWTWVQIPPGPPLLRMGRASEGELG